MPINAVPERDDLVVGQDANGKWKLTGKQPWLEFFKSVFVALTGWKRSYTALKTFDFGNIPAGGEATTTVAVPGARQGDLVVVTAKTLVAGLGAEGLVTANDVVTIRRCNFSTGAIDPASDDFRVVVMQQ